MRLRNKKTGEIKRVEFLADYQTDDGTEIGFRLADSLDVYSYNSLAELNTEWEDYEETKEHWYITIDGDVRVEPENQYGELNSMKQIGNYFETEEEAEKAVEKLKAWKRLKDKGFKFVRIIERNEGHRVGQYLEFEMAYHFTPDAKQIGDDLDLLFGGEE